MYATCFSLADDPDDVAMLDGNAEYRAFYQRANELAGLDLLCRDRARVLQAALRCFMSPHGLTDLEPSRIRDLRLADIREEVLPDTRLRLVERRLKADGTSIADLLGPDIGLLSDNGLRAEVEGVLAAVGGWQQTTEEGLLGWMQDVVQEVNRSFAGERPPLELLTANRLELREGVSELQRERARLHDDPLPLEVVDPSELASRGADFVRGHPEIGPHVLVVWVTTDLLRSQFATPWPVNAEPDTVVGLLSCDRTHGTPIARLCAFAHADPADLVAGIEPALAIVFVTALSTWRSHPPPMEPSWAVTELGPVFVLIDQPIVDFVEAAIASRVRLGWEPIWVDGDRELSVFVFADVQSRRRLFLHVATSAGREALQRWLRSLTEEGVIHEPELGEGSSHLGHLDAALRHIVGTFWEIHQFGGRP